MSDPLGQRQPQEILAELRRLVQDRLAAERDLVADFAVTKQAAQRQYDEARKDVAARHQRDRAEADEEYQARRKEIADRFESDRCAAEQDHRRTCEEIVRQAEQSELDERHRMEEAQWQATAVFEAAKASLEREQKERVSQLDALTQQLAALGAQAELLLARWPQMEQAAPEGAGAPGQGQPFQRLAHLLGLIRNQLSVVYEHANPGFFQAAVSRFRSRTRQQAAEEAARLRLLLAEADEAERASEGMIRAEFERQMAAATAQYRAETRRAADAFAVDLASLKTRQEESLRQAEERFSDASAAVRRRHDHEHRDLENRSTNLGEEIDVRYRRETEGLERGFRQAMADREARFRQQWDEAATRWRTGVERLGDAVAEMNQQRDRLFPDWNTDAWNEWQPPASGPSLIPFGRLQISLGDLENGLSSDPSLVPPVTEFSVPAMFSLGQRSLLLWKSDGDGRKKAVESVQAIMLRMLTSMPPGQVRFLVIDPVGLGENFSAFMHLADFNEQLISSRIWTDSAHIERRLAELTEYMENVIQVYLRTEHPSLAHYNKTAGELAEPYRVLVVANFPAGFTESSAKRLVSIVASGARCGVYTLLSLDRSLGLPREFQPADLERHALRLAWNGERFAWDDPELGGLRLELDRPVGHGRFTEIVRRIGQEAKDAGRIELPFEWIAPSQDQWWTADSRGGVEVPLGRAGVTKLQHLRLGRGTSQHVLISGKTGSGKSTLLHVLIVNLAMRYSPEEIELYLIDFKKGVEFKAYAEAELPHARVVAIESEREFGLSVLERLDAELKERGDLFRARNVQDVHAYREVEPDRRMPRVLLIVDEFQELFVEDDRIAQTAALLLDRLVRQGRAFGIHVLLGSQTLAGAYSIPRATIGQMAVRIALQCSEADAHLILSEENTAARLLSRPGEAIYNDANGLYEGNHPFQVVWLSDTERDRYLERVRQWANGRQASRLPTIVFEGNQPADPAANAPLRELLESPAWSEPCYSGKAWLGSPVAIREPLAAEFARQGGSHLLVVGHQEETAVGILANAVISLAAQHSPIGWDGRPGGARFYVLDGTRPDAPLAGVWDRVAAAVPHDVQVVPPRGARDVIGQVAVELARREENGAEQTPPIYLIVYDLARFRDLRKSDDDFGFSRMDDGSPPNPARQFRTILHDGPSLGIHVLAWGDSHGAISRVLDRGALGDIEMRVLFRMNPGDSSSLMDSTAAAQLGVYRAIFDDEAQGYSEKFRPYGPPSDQWLEWVAGRLKKRCEGEGGRGRGEW